MPPARVMIVEDEAIVAFNLECVVRGMGLRVSAVVDEGEEAVKRFARQPADIVLMDVRLKGEIDGIEAARRIVSRQRIPVIFLTAFHDQDTMARAEDIPPAAFLAKPVDEATLARTIARAMEKSPRAEPDS